LPHAQACDLEAATPTICGTNFNGTATSDGALDAFGAGFTAGNPVHVRVEGSEFSSVDFAATADARGLLLATTPGTLPCYTTPIHVTVTDVASGARAGQAEDAGCLYVRSSAGGGGWHVTFVPIGLLIAVVGGLIRRARRTLA
jgi:hypothetical protein